MDMFSGFGVQMKKMGVWLVEPNVVEVFSQSIFEFWDSLWKQTKDCEFFRSTGLKRKLHTSENTQYFHTRIYDLILIYFDDVNF